MTEIWFTADLHFHHAKIPYAVVDGHGAKS